jgi:hypothetical protein
MIATESSEKLQVEIEREPGGTMSNSRELG